jgi:hypothetical protein
MFPDLAFPKGKFKPSILFPELLMLLTLPGPDEDEDDNSDDCSCPFNKDVVVDIEEDCGDCGDADDRCRSSSFCADLYGSEKNKIELVSFLFKELVIADAVKKSSPVMPIRQQARTTGKANPTRSFLWFIIFKKTTLLCF